MENQINLSQELDNFIDAVLGAKLEDSLTMIQQNFAQINQRNPNESERFQLVLLESFWNFFQAQVSILHHANFEQGLAQIEQASAGFQNIGLTDLVTMMAGSKLYYAAIVDIKTQNLSAGLEKIEQAKAHFKKIDKYGQHFSQELEVMEAEGYFISGVKYTNELDFENAEIDIAKASSLSKKIAVKYFAKDSLEYHLFMGLGFEYSAFAALFIQFSKLNSYSFDYFAYSDNEAYENSTKAVKFLSESITFSELARINLQIAKGINLLTETLFNIGKWMNNLVNGENEPLTADLRAMKKSVSNAKKFFRDIGQNGLVFIRVCQQVEVQLSNLDKFSRQQKPPIAEQVKTSQLTDKVKNYVKRGLHEKAIDYLVANSMDFDYFNDILLLKSRQSRLTFDNINGTISAENFQIEENKITEAILRLVEMLEEEDFT